MAQTPAKSYDNTPSPKYESAVTDYIDPGEKVESLTTVNFGDQAPEKT
jgi:hypothetical protein